jgi:hypothetical protein
MATTSVFIAGIFLTVQEIRLRMWAFHLPDWGEADDALTGGRSVPFFESA